MEDNKYYDEFPSDDEIRKWNEEMYKLGHIPNNDDDWESRALANLDAVLSKEQEEIYKFTEGVLKEANEWGMETEVVVWALKHLKDDPSLTIEEALICGLGEWIK